MIRPQLKTLFQLGFTVSATAMLKAKFGGVYLDRSSAFGGDKPWPKVDRLFCYSTHSSWWDPITAAFLAVGQMRYPTIAPMAVSQFTNYTSLRYAGVFGVGPGDGPEVERVIDEHLRANPHSCVWVTPQGQFSPNEIPQPPFKSGLSRWSNQPSSTRLPIAIHYAFTDALSPRVFVRIGNSVAPTEGSLEEDSAVLRLALENETRALLESVWQAQSGPRFDESRFQRLKARFI